MSKAVKTASKVEQFAAKKIGSNIIVTLGKQKFSRKVTKDEYDTIAKKIELYNKRPSETVKNAIIKLASPETAKKNAEKEKVVAQKKGLKQQVKKAAKTSKVEKKEEKNLLDQLEELIQSDETAIPKLQALLDKFKKVEEKKEVEKPVPAYTGLRRGGEY